MLQQTRRSRVRTAALGLTLIAAGCAGEIAPDPGPGGSGGTVGRPGPNGALPMGTEAPSPRLLRQLTLSEYHDTITDLLRITNPDTTNLPPDVPVRGFTTNVASAFVDPNNVDHYVSVGGALADRAVQESYGMLVPCLTTDPPCAASFVEKFGMRAFRRPLEADEKARYLALFDPAVTGGDFKIGVSLVVKTMLVSPYFLLRSELGTDTGQGRFVLTPFETASALSYTYWGTMPDDALFASAQSGALATKKEIETQARRLLSAPRGRARIAIFFNEWLEASRAYVATKDPATYSALKDAATTTAIVNAMRAEEDAFVTNAVFDSTKKFSELFAADYTFVNDRLATYYGLPLPGTGDKVTKVSLGAGSERGGLLTMGMFLFGHARTNQSSPTQRGHAIRANIFCTDVPPPPPGVDATVKPGTPGKTGRAQIEALTGTGGCAACHSLMNPIGYGLESFDGAAQLRTMDNGEPVDNTGAINELTGAGSSITFKGAKELSRLIAGNATAQQCFASNYYRFARGFDPAQTGVDGDGYAAQKLGQTFVQGNLDLPELFVQIALQDSFTTRRSVEVLKR
jgi:hypothetical protein